MKRIIFTLILSCILFAGSVSAQLPETFTNRLQVVLDSVGNKHGLKGISAAMFVPGSGMWQGTHGISHAGQPITPGMVFGIASNTKTYVATVLLKLQEMGKLDLDDSIGTWIVNVPNINGQITIRQLLNHTSGIGDYDYSTEIQDSMQKDFMRNWMPEEILAKFPVTAPRFAPGKGWFYSNTNFVIAGLIASKVMNKPFSSLLRELVLAPHGLDHTYLYPEENITDTIPHMWWRTGVNGSMVDLMAVYHYQLNSEYSLSYTCGGILATASDNAMFQYKLITGQILSPASMQEMMQWIKRSETTAYGLGLYRYSKQFDGRTIYGHGGTNMGFISENAIDSVSGISITILTNQDSLLNDVLFLNVIGSLFKVVKEMNIQTGVNDRVQQQPLFKLYPNPAADYIEIDAQDVTGVIQVRITDLSGKICISQDQLNSRTAISLQDLQQGLYFLHLTDQRGATQTRKFQVIR